MSQSEHINELASALSKAQGAMQNAAMNRVNPHFKSKYADLAALTDAIRGPLSANGLAVVQIIQPSERGLVLKTTLMHSSGQYISTEYPLPHSPKPHEMGSGLTYARRYSLGALVCIASDEDDDGNAAMASKNGNGHTANGNGHHGPDDQISVGQLKEIERLIEEVGANADNVCKACHVEGLEDLTQAQFQKAKTKLEAMRAPL